MNPMYEQQQALSSIGPVENRKPTSRERLMEHKRLLEEHLANINAALDALDSNPDFERIHNLLMKVL